MTPEEHILWSSLRGRKLMGLKFHRQFSVGRFILDFYCPFLKLAIELDGAQHEASDARIYDQERDVILQSHKIHIMRFSNRELAEPETVLCTIRRSCHQRLPLEHKRE
jgi:very-short-patch-repair endonuclease